MAQLPPDMALPVEPKPLRATVVLPCLVPEVVAVLRGLASTRTRASVPAGRVTVVPEPVE